MPRILAMRLALAATAALAAAAYVAPAAFADDRRGRGWDNDRNRGGYGYRDDRRGRGGGWDRGRNVYSKPVRPRTSFSFHYVQPRYYAYPTVRHHYVPYATTTVIVPQPRYPHPNAYGLAPYQCRIDYRFDMWRGHPAEISLEICADAYGAVYVVQGSQRLIRYR